jgi:hypothetical protein
MTVSNRALIMLADLLRQRRSTLGTDGDAWAPAERPCW